MTRRNAITAVLDAISASEIHTLSTDVTLTSYATDGADTPVLSYDGEIDCDYIAIPHTWGSECLVARANRQAIEEDMPQPTACLGADGETYDRPYIDVRGEMSTAGSRTLPCYTDDLPLWDSWRDPVTRIARPHMGMFLNLGVLRAIAENPDSEAYDDALAVCELYLRLHDYPLADESAYSELCNAEITAQWDDYARRETIETVLSDTMCAEEEITDYLETDAGERAFDIAYYAWCSDVGDYPECSSMGDVAWPHDDTRDTTWARRILADIRHAIRDRGVIYA